MRRFIVIRVRVVGEAGLGAVWAAAGGGEQEEKESPRQEREMRTSHRQ